MNLAEWLGTAWQAAKRRFGYWFSGTQRDRVEQAASTGSPDRKTLFVPCAPVERLDPRFQTTATWPGAAPARAMLDDVYQCFEDPDGNFLEQFQTTGFDARLFELYLSAYFSRSGYTIDRTHGAPDFLVSRGETNVAVEATTVNRSQSGPLAGRKQIADLAAHELYTYQDQELPIRFGSALFSKFKKRYWELEHCADKPFVIAVQAFHDEEAHGFADSALSQLLYGIRQSAQWSAQGELQIDSKRVDRHEVEGKVVPSAFFAQEGSG